MPNALTKSAHQPTATKPAAKGHPMPYMSTEAITAREESKLRRLARMGAVVTSFATSYPDA